MYKVFPFDTLFLGWSSCSGPNSKNTVFLLGNIATPDLPPGFCYLLLQQWLELITEHSAKPSQGYPWCLKPIENSLCSFQIIGRQLSNIRKNIFVFPMISWPTWGLQESKHETFGKKLRLLSHRGLSYCQAGLRSLCEENPSVNVPGWSMLRCWDWAFVPASHRKKLLAVQRPVFVVGVGTSMNCGRQMEFIHLDSRLLHVF